MTSCSLSTFSFVFETLYAPAPLSRRTRREVLLDIYSRTSCSWRSLSPNFPENWKNMLLNAFLLTYVWNFVILFSGRSRDPNLSLLFSLSYVLYTLYFSLAGQIVRILAPASLRFALCISYKIDTVFLRSCSQLSRPNVGRSLSSTRIIIVVI